MKTLVIGIGNPGRGDDGLGPALVERLADVPPESIREGAVVETPAGCAAVWKYQLNIEDAALAGEYERVVFADAAADASPGTARLEPLAPAASIAFTTHELPPASVLALCQDLYGRTPEAWLLSVGGSSWDLGQGLSERARASLVQAEALLRSRLEKPRTWI
ncbi:MAG: hydrogenase maturation protease [Acidobacteriota bacterium]|nr:hydrogenase maturation protease [Acidobacteriota bacterium]